MRGELRAVFLELVVLNYRVQLATEQVKLATQNVSSVGEKVKVWVVDSDIIGRSKDGTTSREISLLDGRLNFNAKFPDLLQYMVPCIEADIWRYEILFTTPTKEYELSGFGCVNKL